MFGTRQTPGRGSHEDNETFVKQASVDGKKGAHRDRAAAGLENGSSTSYCVKSVQEVVQRERGRARASESEGEGGRERQRQTEAIENQVLTGSPPILTWIPFTASTLGTTKSGYRTKSDGFERRGGTRC